VRSVYNNLLFNYSKLKLLLYQDSLYTNFLRAAELKTSGGESPLLEKVTAETRSMEIKTMLNQVRSDILIGRQNLAVLMNEKEAVNITDAELSKIDFTFSADSAALSSSPTVAMMKQQIAISKKETSLEKLQLMPDVSIGYFNQSNKELNNDHRFTGIQAGISIPLIFGSQTAKIQAAKINEQIAQTNYETYNSGVQGAFQNLLHEYQKQKYALDYYENKAVHQADMIIEQSGKSYMTGDIGYIEYVTNLDKALEIKTNYLQTLNDHNQSIIAIDALLGKTK
jgi:cobalt-zinc-cadmium resistance protein CzcA